jgi:hypothetical protein
LPDFPPVRPAFPCSGFSRCLNYIFRMDPDFPHKKRLDFPAPPDYFG